MHVAINGWFWDQPNVGSGQYVRRLVPWLMKVDPSLKITLIMPPHNPNPDNLPANVTAYPTGQQAKTSKFGKVWFEQWTFPRAAKASGADLAHVPYWGGPLSCDIPVVTSVLDLIPLIYPIYSMGAANRLYLSLVSTSARSAEHVITISETSKLDIEYWLTIPSNKITVTYLAADEQYHPMIGRERDEAVREKYNLPEKYVFYMGGFDKRKRVSELLEAYIYIRRAIEGHYPLVIGGREPKWDAPLFPNLREIADELGVSESVQWIGYVDEEDKPSLYRMASVFVYPSEYEGFGLPPLEAMASGTPVVAADEVIFDEMLEEGAYLVDGARAMAGAIISLNIQPPLRETMVNQGLAQATKYSWRKTAKRTLEVYQKVVKEES